MSIQTTTLAAAIAATLCLGASHAAAADTGRTLVRDSVAAVVPAPATSHQRFIVRTTAPSAQGRAVLGRALPTSAARAGLATPVRATATSPARAAVSAQVLRSTGMPGWHVVRTSRPLTASEATSFVRELAQEAGVVAADIDHLYRRADVGRAPIMLPAALPNDPDTQRLQWNFYDNVGGVRAEQGWAMSTGAGVVVAVLDTGIVQGQQDLAGNVVPGYDMITDRRISRRAADGRVAGGWDLGDWIEQNYCTTLGAPPHPPSGSSWHGTHVAGTIAQETNNGVRVAGLAHGAKVMPVRVLGSCGGFSSDIADGMLWAAGLPVEGLPVNTNPAEVLNMSLGSGGPSSCPSFYQQAIDRVNAAGSVIVVAAGNDNADAGTYTMSSCNGVISVGASRITGGKAFYSSWGAKVDLSAPGGGGNADGNPNGYIWQVIDNGTEGPTGVPVTGGFIGTSMASPHVAAAAAMVQAIVDAPLNHVQMRDLLRRTARPFPVAVPAATPMGAGILDVDALLRAATEPPCVENCGPPVIVLANRVEARNQASGFEDAIYSFTAEPGKVLSLMTYGGTGNVSMHVAYDRIPTPTNRDAFSTRAGNTETVRILAPRAGTYYVRLSGTYAGLTVVARQ